MDVLEMIESLQAQNEELEKRLKALSLVTTPSAQIDQLNLTVLQMHEILSSLHTAFSEYVQSNDTTQTKELVDELKLKVEIIQTNYEYFYKDFEQEIEYLNNRVDDANTNMTNHVNSYNDLCEIVRQIRELQLPVHTKQIEDLTAVVNTNTENIATNATGVSRNASSIKNMNNYVVDLQNRVTELESNSGTSTGGGTDYSDEITELEDNYTLLREQVNSMSNRVDTISSTQESHNTESISRIIQLEQDVSSLQGNSGSSGSGFIETTHFIQRATNYSAKKAANSSTYISPYITVTCVPTCEVTVKAIVTGYSSSKPASDCSVGLCKNTSPGNPVIKAHFTWTANFTQEVSYTFMPTQERNDFNVWANVGANTVITKIEWIVTGRNPRIFNINDVYITMFNNKYYINKTNSSGNYCLLVQTPETVDLSAAGTEYTINESNPSDYQTFVLLPSATLDENNLLQYDESVLHAFGVKNGYITLYATDVSDGVINIKANSDGCGAKIMVCMSANNADGWSYSMAYRNLVGVASFKKFNVVTYNGENLVGKAYCCQVFNNNISPTDQPMEFYGVIVTEPDGTNYYYPQVKSTTRVELPKGENATAFYQSDTKNINFYVRQVNKVCKYVLRYIGEGNQYELSDEAPVEYLGAEEFLEGYNGQYFIKVNGVYQVKTSS